MKPLQAYEQAWRELRAHIEELVLKADSEFPNFEGGYDAAMEEVLGHMDDAVAPPSDAKGEWETTDLPNGKTYKTYRRKTEHNEV